MTIGYGLNKRSFFSYLERTHQWCLIGILVAWCGLELRAEVSVYDSLQTTLLRDLADTSRLYTYCKLIQLSPNGEVNRWYKEGQQFARQIDNPRWLQKIEFHRGLQYKKSNQLDKAIDHFNALFIDKNSETSDPPLLGQVNLELSELYQKKGKLNQAEQVTRVARSIYKKLDDKKEQGRSLYFLSVIYRLKGEPERALSILDSAKLMVDQNDQSLYASILNNSGRIYRGLANYDSARHYYLKGQQLVQGIDRTMESKFLNNLGNIEHTTGNLDAALRYYLESLELKEQLKHTRGIAVAYHNIGAVRMDLKAYQLALEDFKNSMRLSEETDYAILKIHNAQKIGNALRELDKNQEAITHHEQALAWSTNIGFEAGKADAHINLAEDYKALGKYASALDHLFEAIDIAERIKRKAYHGFALTSLAETFLAMQSRPNFEGANLIDLDPRINNIELLLKQGGQIARETGNFNGIETSLSALRRYYQINKKYKQEAEISRLYIAFRDSLFNHQSAESISQWQTKYKTAEKEKEIELLKREKELQTLKVDLNRNRYIWATLLLVLFGALAITFVYYKLKNRRIRMMENMRNTISSDLHDDVGSILTGLAMQSEILEMTSVGTEKSKLHQLHEMSRHAMTRIRDAVWAMDTSKDNWTALADRMKDHAEIHIGPSHMGYRFDFDIADMKKLLPIARQQVYLIFKEAVTNALKHSNGDQIEIKLKGDKKRLDLQVADNGQVERMHNSGIGLTSMQRRADKIGGQLTIQKEDGFAVKLHVDL